MSKENLKPLRHYIRPASYESLYVLKIGDNTVITAIRSPDNLSDFQKILLIATRVIALRDEHKLVKQRGKNNFPFLRTHIAIKSLPC